MNIPAKDEGLSQKIRKCQEKCGRTYGYRRVQIWLDRNGVHHNPKTVLRIMRKYNLLSVVRRRKYNKYGKQLHKYKNELARNFIAERPSLKWVTDILSILSQTQSEWLHEKRKSLQSCNSTTMAENFLTIHKTE